MKAYVVIFSYYRTRTKWWHFKRSVVVDQTIVQAASPQQAEVAFLINRWKILNPQTVEQVEYKHCYEVPAFEFLDMRNKKTQTDNQ